MVGSALKSIDLRRVNRKRKKSHLMDRFCVKIFITESINKQTDSWAN